MRAPAPCAEHDRQLAVLHRRVERLLDRAAEAVDLVDEEDAAGLERGEEGGDVGLALQRRPRGLHQRHPHLLGDDVRQRGLAQPGRPGQQDVVERLVAAAGGLDEDRQLPGHLLLVDEVGERARPQRAVEVLVGNVGAGVVHPDVIGRGLVSRRERPVDPGGADPSRSRLAPRGAGLAQGGGEQLLGVIALDPVQQLLGLQRRVAEVDQAVAGKAARVVRRSAPARITSSSSAPATFSRSSTMIRSEVRLPIPGTAWKRLASPAAIARSSSRTGPPESAERATLGPIPLTEISSPKRSRSSSEAKPKSASESSREISSAWRKASRPVGGHRLQRLGRDRQPVADAAGVDRRRGRDAAPSPLRGRRRSSGRLAETASSRQRRRFPPVAPPWQIATASASAAWSGVGGSGRPSSVPTIRCTWSLPARAGAADRLLDRLRRVGEAVDARLRGRQHRGAAGPADGHRRVHVLAEVEVLERHRRRLVPADQLCEGSCGSAPGGAPSPSRARSRPRRRRGRPCGCPRS